ncbi:sigma-70 family RNA polymerase sigma factor [Pseudonocardia sp. TRM90224]|uniref:sigma-70 family RNA polymerase sigma factor n=1 Tax=Pseudonocardia sp. TRM90224 TaxID=2812678 RepID=UPI001E3D6610|nr:sigma-70 family RNA polymerase sigma factor [Pseudonocardia sp. TRM90224]
MDDNTTHQLGDTMETDMTFQRERRQLLAIAFRILGSTADAEDIVQEAWIRYARADLDTIENVAAWLTTVVTRLCLDVLRRAHEQPAELPDEPDDGSGPAETALLASELTSAFVVVMERLTPPQRVALIMHDVFGAPFDEIAHVLDTTPGSAKKLASRARGRVRGATAPATADPGATREVVGAFLHAAQRGDVDALLGVLAPDVTRTADPQAVPAGAALQVRGARTVAEQTRNFAAAARLARLVVIDGEPGLALRSGGHVRLAITFHVVADRIERYDVVADPRRLALLNIED